MLNFFPKWCGLLLIGLFVVNNAQSEQGEGKSPLSREAEISKMETVEYWENAFKNHNEKEPFKFELYIGYGEEKTLDKKQAIAQAFLEAIKKNPLKIKILNCYINIRSNQSVTFFYKQLFEVLCNNTYLKTLYIYPMSDKAIPEFINLIKKNKTLQSIILPGQFDMYERDVIKIANALSENKSLTYLDLSMLMNLTVAGRNALKKVEEERGENNELIVKVTNAPDSLLNKNKGY